MNFAQSVRDNEWFWNDTASTCVAMPGLKMGRLTRNYTPKTGNAKVQNAWFRALNQALFFVRPRGGALLTQTQLSDQGQVTVSILALEVVEQFAATANHAQQTTTTVVIFFVLFEVRRQIVDTSGQDSHLNFWTACVASATRVVFDDVCFNDSGNDISCYLRDLSPAAPERYNQPPGTCQRRLNPRAAALTEFTQPYCRATQHSS